MDESLLIGKKDGLPWHIPEDLKRFNSLTKGHIVVMGKNTYFSLPDKFRPLPNRRNIVISREEIAGVETFASIESFIVAMEKEHIQEVMLIGGAMLYNQFFQRGVVDAVELTLVDGKHDGDIFVEEFRDGFVEVKSEDFEQGRFLRLEKKRQIAYIDAQNVHKATQELGWIIDWQKFYEYLQRKFGPTEVKIFFGYVSKYRTFYKTLEKIGYTVVFKQVAEKPDGTIKGNVDIDMTMHVMEDFLGGILVGGIIVSGDADFNTLVARLHHEKTLVRLIVPNHQKISRYLRYAANNNFQSLTDIVAIIEKNKETP